MIQSRSVIICERDFSRLQTLIGKTDPVAVRLLSEEIDAATIVPDAELSNDVVAMGSLVTFEDLGSGECFTVQLVYPHESDVAQRCVSILAPVGAALVGLRVDEEIEWPMPNGRARSLRVLKVAPGADQGAL